MWRRRGPPASRRGRAWTPHSAIFIVADEDDFTGNAVNGGWDSPAGCCDSPVPPAGDPDISASWPGGLYGGASCWPTADNALYRLRAAQGVVGLPDRRDPSRLEAAYAKATAARPQRLRGRGPDSRNAA